MQKLEGTMRGRVRVAVTVAFLANIPATTLAAELVGNDVPRATAVSSRAAKKSFAFSSGAPEPYEYYRYYRSYWEYGYYKLYGAFGPIGYWGYYRPYERDPWSWWKLP